MASTNLGRVMPVDKGAYDASATYEKLDMVHTSDSTYVSKVNNNTGHAVTDTNYWQCYASGVAATEAAQQVLADEGSESGSTAGDGSRWGAYKAAEASRNTAAGNVEGSASSVAGDGSRWGTYKTAEANRDAARETAEGTAESAAGSNNRWGAYKTAEAARDTARSNAEGSSSSEAGDGTRWGAYKTAEAARDAARATAEGTSSSEAGDGTRWGAYKTAEEERSATITDHETRIETLEETKANKDGYYQQLTAGLAENLIDTKGQGTEQVFTDRPSCDDVSISDDGVALFQKLYGNSLAWNQILTGIQSGEYYGVTLTKNANGSMTLSGTATGTAYLSIGGNLLANHKYIVWLYCPTGTPTSALRDSVVGGLYRSATLISFNQNASLTLHFKEGDVLDETVFCNAIDLTFMGLGSISTVAEFEQYYHDAYYAYNAGTIINNMVQKYVTDGFNQFDESTFEIGKWMWNGQIITGSEYATRRASSTYFPCFPSTKYYAYCNTDNVNGVVIAFYDADKTFISQTATGNAEITSPANARFFRVASVSPTAEVNINLSWSGYRNGEYEPYWQRKMSVDMTKLYGKLNGAGDMVQIFPNGGRSDGSVYDVADIANKTADVKIGNINLGNLDYVLASGSHRFSGTLDNGQANDNPCLVSSRYNAVAFDNRQLTTDKTMWVYATENKITIVDDAYSDTALFKAAVAGIYVNYQLATPLHYTDVQMSDDDGATFYDIPSAQKVADFGTESIEPTGVDANGVPLTAPLRAIIKYNDDFTRTLVNLPKNYISKESMTNFLSALGTAMNGTWAMTFDATDGEYDFTFTPNA